MCDIRGAVGDGVVGWGADDSGSVGLDGEEVRGAVDVVEVGFAEGYVVCYTHFEGFRVVFSEEDGVGKGSELELVEVVGSVDVGGVVWIAGDAKVVTEGKREFAFAANFFLVKVVESCVRFDDRINGLSVSRAEERLVVRPPDRDAVGKMRHENLAIVDKGIFPSHILVAALEATVQVANTASSWLDEHTADVGEELEWAVVVVKDNSR